MQITLQEFVNLRFLINIINNNMNRMTFLRQSFMVFKLLITSNRKMDMQNNTIFIIYMQKTPAHIVILEINENLVVRIQQKKVNQHLFLSSSLLITFCLFYLFCPFY